MNEQEWLSDNDLNYLLDGLESQVSVRKFRLFAVACCRRNWHAINDERCRAVIDLAEGLADSSTRWEALRDIRPIIEDALNRHFDAAPLVAKGRMEYFANRDDALSHDVLALAEVMSREEFPAPFANDAVDALLGLVGHFATPTRKWGTAAGDQAVALAVEREVPNVLGLLHDIVGNPFRSIAINPAWLAWNDRTIPRIAQAIYEQRSFSDLPILADALEDTGCGDADILNHCRSEGPHVRGCWVVDALLGKE